MGKVEQLYDWQGEEGEYHETCINEGRPQWFKMWCEKYADALDIKNLDTDLTQAEKKALFEDVGIAFINALFYFMYRVEVAQTIWSYKPRTRDGRILYNVLRRDIDSSYADYDKRVRDGKKGGRPKKQDFE